MTRAEINHRGNHVISEVEIIYKPNRYGSSIITTSQEAADIFRHFWNPWTIEYYEEFKVMYLDRGGKVLGVQHLSTGGLNGTMADVRMIFQGALKSCAHTIIVAHSHPSGRLTPSQADRDLTVKIKEAGKILDIPLSDHLILTGEDFMSFADSGYL